MIWSSKPSERKMGEEKGKGGRLSWVQLFRARDFGEKAESWAVGRREILKVEVQVLCIQIGSSLSVVHGVRIRQAWGGTLLIVAVGSPHEGRIDMCKCRWAHPIGHHDVISVVVWVCHSLWRRHRRGWGQLLMDRRGMMIERRDDSPSWSRAVLGGSDCIVRH